MDLSGNCKKNDAGRHGRWLYLTDREFHNWGRESGAEKQGSGGLRGAEERSLDGGGEADDLGEGVGIEIGDPEVAAGIDGDGEALAELGSGRPAGCRGEDLSGRTGSGTGELGDGGTKVVRDPDVAGAIDRDALRMVDAGLVITVAAGDDGAVSGELADAVAVVVGDPDEAALIDGDAGARCSRSSW